MSEAAEIRKALRTVRRSLGTSERRQSSLYEQRLKLWRQARAAGISAAEIGELSGVSPITVRQLMRRSDR